MMDLNALDDIALGKMLRNGRGPLCPLQVQVMRLLSRLGNGAREIPAPNIAAIARQLGVSRPLVSNAITALKRKGAIEMRRERVVVPRERTKRVLRIIFDPDQPMLPFGHAD